MNLMQNVRRIGLVGLALVAGNVSAFADSIIGWDATTTPYTVTTSSTGTEISLSNALMVNPTSFVLDQTNGQPLPQAPAYLTFDFISTGLNTGTAVNGGTSGSIAQNFAGTFSIKDGLGNTLLAGTNLAGQINTTASSAGVTRSINFAPTTTTAFTGSYAGGFTGPFDINLNLAGKGPKVVTAGSGTTLSFSPSTANGANNGWSTNNVTEATQVVPEPSTFALLGLGVAGMAVGAYRRRKAAAAV